ncbi:hypothetical protein FW774_02110 (plasmid) [Pedobacter sp. BS3]|uniref:hypothetical protein n=1 Tax=Pedobacter sp. BS3 TaxID=2567937 RepID=UPI0011EFEFBD|nr:hypothetical protein [Pedobacter sp. BS3]TZF85887.1 hypothetical protein FW774_02110 [Pedobacter sp. BS3]
MRFNILRFFALLDVLSIALLSQQVFNIIIHSNTLVLQTPSLIKVILLPLIYLSLFFTAFLLFQQKRSGLIIYYIQFPVRLLVWVFSFGFITMLASLSSNPQLFGWLFRLVVILEFFRLYISIRQHGKLNRRF